MQLKKIIGKLFHARYPTDPVLNLGRELGTQILRESHKDIYAELMSRACQSSADYVEARFERAIYYNSRDGFLRASLKFRALEGGLIAEFGVFQGDSIRVIAKAIEPDVVHGFDSFQGLPEAWSGTSADVGRFLVDKLPEVPGNVRLHVGLFNETLPKFLVENPGKSFSVLHIDCDIYSSTKTIFDLCSERIVPGTVIIFDEYFNYPNWQHHEYKAFQEFIARRPDLKYEYTAFGPHTCVSVRIS